MIRTTTWHWHLDQISLFAGEHTTKRKKGEDIDEKPAFIANTKVI